MIIKHSNCYNFPNELSPIIAQKQVSQLVFTFLVYKKPVLASLFQKRKMNDVDHSKAEKTGVCSIHRGGKPIINFESNEATCERRHFEQHG